jgi:DNA-directed RNA polymerase beta subunit
MNPPLTPILVDAATIRRKIHENTVKALEKTFPIDLKGRTLAIENIKVHAKDYSPEDQKRALLTGMSLVEPVKGTLVLKSADGQVIDRQHNFTVVHLPHFTDRHTVITGGNEYQIANQLRRKPGVYTQRADNGELHTVFNLARGRNFNVTFDEKNGTFFLQYGTANIPMYPVLRALGVSHQEIARSWGGGVADQNKALYGDKEHEAIASLYTRVEHPATMNPKNPHEVKLRQVLNRFRVSEMDPQVTAFTLGTAHERVTPAAMLDAGKRILQVHAGKAEPDDTDSLTFKTFHTVDSHIAERLTLAARAWAPKARMALNGKSKIQGALKPAPLTASLRDFVTSSTLSAVPTGINPLELIDHAVKVTALGEGGISSDRAIPLNARMTHSTHFGAIDPIRTPESNHSGVDVRASILAHRDDHGNLYSPVINVKNGKMEFIKAGDLEKYVVAFPNQTLTGQVDAFVKGRVQKTPAGQVTHQMAHTSHTYSPATTLIPGIHGIQGNRAIMGSKMGTQALPLVHAEAPFLQVKSHFPEGHSFERVYGAMINPRAPISGTVTRVANGYIHIQPDGTKKQASAPPTAVHFFVSTGEKLSSDSLYTSGPIGAFEVEKLDERGEWKTAGYVIWANSPPPQMKTANTRLAAPRCYRGWDDVRDWLEGYVSAEKYAEFDDLMQATPLPDDPADPDDGIYRVKDFVNEAFNTFNELP